MARIKNPCHIRDFYKIFSGQTISEPIVKPKPIQKPIIKTI